jgi:hypothetical protein
VNRTPSVSSARSFNSIGTPANGPVGPAAAAARADANVGVTTAFSVGLTASIRSIAQSTSSVACTSPRRTSAAWSVASSAATSSAGGVERMR